ncbi:hypothetical protein L512_0576 [Bordetella bronchiseptica MBORD624]|nr:hypothetical protein L512_0576 [Bordetella bronchiseptica MBORD624]
MVPQAPCGAFCIGRGADVRNKPSPVLAAIAAGGNIRSQTDGKLPGRYWQRGFGGMRSRRLSTYRRQTR